ncbi:hypothetical protein Z043_111800 [Scleropages formosus]|uniref:Uncharacterized protein n=1 Tax=Scleropages formosus TaxID=113540 RepID=A0A0P7WYZ8_SCLFO|nr:hypothetical protein Z043_111800 [Scleropages formosus]
MAVNTDAEFDKAALGGPGVAPSGESLETEKLLSAAGTPDAARRHDLRLSGPFAVNLGSVKSLDADLNGRSTPLRSGSMGHLRAPPRSPSHVSVRSRTSSVGTAAKEQPEPRDYLLLAFCSCFCFFWPLSIAALVFSILVSGSRSVPSSSWPHHVTCAELSALKRRVRDGNCSEPLEMARNSRRAFIVCGEWAG